jgi:hypothetical protein
MDPDNWSDFSGYDHLELYPNNNYKSFVPHMDTEFQVGGTIVKLKAGKKAEFWENGNLTCGTVAEDTSLEAFGVEVRILANSKLELFSEGGVHKITLGRQKGILNLRKIWNYRGKKYAPRSTLEFSESGEVEHVSPGDAG